VTVSNGLLFLFIAFNVYPAKAATPSMPAMTKLEKGSHRVLLGGEVSFDEQGRPRSASRLFSENGAPIEPWQKWTWQSGPRELELGACGLQEPVRFHEDGSYESGCWFTRDEEFSINDSRITLRGLPDFRERLASIDITPFVVMHASGLPAKGVLAKGARLKQRHWTTDLPAGSSIEFFADGQILSAYVDSVPVRAAGYRYRHTGLATFYADGRPHIVDFINVPSPADSPEAAKTPLLERTINVAGQTINAVQMLEYWPTGKVRMFVPKYEIELASAQFHSESIKISPFTIVFLDQDERVEATQPCDQSIFLLARCSVEARKNQRLQFGWNVWQRTWVTGF
jgi:hypothetical protein